MEKLSSEVKLKYRLKPKTHRHILCLYGEDEKLLRITAMELGMTVSHLIRLAVHYYLPVIKERTFPWRYIFYYGTKIARIVSINRLIELKFPSNDTLTYIKWSYRDWWRRPRGKKIKIPYEVDLRSNLTKKNIYKLTHSKL